jgi:hypothetical protein
MNWSRLVSIPYPALHPPTRSDLLQYMRFVPSPHLGHTILLNPSQRLWRSALSCPCHYLIQTIPPSLSNPFLSLLLIEYVASTASGHEVDKAMARKEKTALPIPVRHRCTNYLRHLR